MKTNMFKSILFTTLILLSFASCTSDNDYKVVQFNPLVFAQDFNVGADNTELILTDWNNYAEVGTAKWKQQIYSGNGYAEFSSYQSGQASNIAWLISPAINMDAHEGEKLVFQSSQAYVSSAANSLQVLISTDYDGTNVTAATWTPVNATLPTTSATYFEFLKSGEIDLSSYTGNIYIAFKCKGSGTNSALDGSYQIDNIRIFY